MNFRSSWVRGPVLAKRQLSLALTTGLRYPFGKRVMQKVLRQPFGLFG
jgi:hypothetical protein